MTIRDFVDSLRFVTRRRHLNDMKDGFRPNYLLILYFLRLRYFGHADTLDFAEEILRALLKLLVLRHLYIISLMRRSRF